MDNAIGLVQSYEEGTAVLMHPSGEMFDNSNNFHEFAIEATNLHGKAVSKIVCTDAPNSDAPKILNPLSAQVLKTNSTLKLSINYSGTPSPTIEWRKNGKSLDSGGDTKIETSPKKSSTLLVKMMDRSKGGKYEAVVTNKYGEARSTASILVCDLKETPDIIAPRFVEPLHPTLVRCGEVVILQALVHSTPNCKFQWTCHGKPVMLSNNLRIVTHDNKSILIVRHFKKVHEGIYSCRAENVGGSVTSTASVRIKTEKDLSQQLFSPRFTTKLPTYLVIPPNEEMRLKCVVMAQPTATVRWLLNGVEILPNNDVEIVQETSGTCMLHIRSADGCSGEYTCYAKNECGQSITTTQVLAEGTCPICTLIIFDKCYNSCWRYVNSELLRLKFPLHTFFWKSYQTHLQTLSNIFLMSMYYITCYEESLNSVTRNRWHQVVPQARLGLTNGGYAESLKR